LWHRLAEKTGSPAKLVKAHGVPLAAYVAGFMRRTTHVALTGRIWLGRTFVA
jgi:hypothetical protein